ncbi:MAG TPA: 6-phosphofructokinase [Tepidisphaeraceae bacterium]|jgi:6-phosphofructokinase 1|nr:6-phosphofructokinase [Tepidisphaeraceae bacterium]
MAIKGNAVIGQSGGPTSVINQSLVGVIQEVRKSSHIGKLLGARHGVRGIIDHDFIDLGQASDELLHRIAQTPAAALGSTRDKPDQAYCEKIFAAFKEKDVKYFFYIGGNDSADTARIVYELSKKEGYDLKVFHVPKTIDNDLRVHDHTPGFGSAGKFVAAAVMGDNFDNKSLPGIKVDVIMGRNAGFLTAASALAKQSETDGPHLIYCPEVPVTEEKFLADVDAIFTKTKRCLIAVSEGIVLPDGTTWAQKLAADIERDSHGNIQLANSGLGDYLGDLIQTRLKPAGGKSLRVRSDTFGYLQRSFPGFVSETDATEARMVGQMAVKYSADEKNVEGSIAMRRQPGSQYKVETFLTPLSTVARETKHMPAEFINQQGNYVTQAFLDYAKPLIGALPVVGSFDELR